MTIGTILISLAIGLGALLLFLVGFVILKTLLFSPCQSKGNPRDLASIDGQSVAERLGLAVQIPTLSYLEPEKFDRDAFLELHRLLKTLYPKVHAQLKVEPVNDLSLLYTWEGSNPELKPIMLISHLDVVPADDEGWTYPPFSGEIAEGFVWGRGTLDVKNGVIGVLEAVEYLLKEGFQPERTVYLGFGHDEEVSGRHGAVVICKLLKSRGVELGSLLDEGGAVIEGFLPGVDTPVAVIGISEKGYLSLRLTVSVEGGHSSMPPQETAISILSKAIVNLETKPMPPHLEVAEFLMSYLGSALPFYQRMLFANTWLFGGILKKQLSKSHLLNATIRTTTAPTIINAGVKDNVLPGKAEAVVNFRLLPGDDLRSVYEMVLERIHDERVVVTPYEGEMLEGGAGWEPSPVADSESPYFKALSNLIKAAFPGALVSPYLVMGGTDARHYAPVTDCALRFSPIQMTREDLQRVHGVNERLSIENCARMAAFYIAYIRDLSSLDGKLDAFSETAAEKEFEVVTEVLPDEVEEAPLTPDSVEDEFGEEESNEEE